MPCCSQFLPGGKRKDFCDACGYSQADHDSTLTSSRIGGTAERPAIKVSALGIQEGGAHYKTKAIQPVEYIHANKLPFIEGSVVKYITRWRDKGGVEDLKKIKHYIDLLIELEARHAKG